MRLVQVTQYLIDDSVLQTLRSHFAEHLWCPVCQEEIASTGDGHALNCNLRNPTCVQTSARAMERIDSSFTCDRCDEVVEGDTDDGHAADCPVRTRPFDAEASHRAISEARSTNPTCHWAMNGSEPCRRISGSRCVSCQAFFAARTCLPHACSFMRDGKCSMCGGAR